MNRDLFKRPIVRQALVYIAVMLTCIGVPVLVSALSVTDMLQMVYYFFGYFVAFNFAVYLIGWIIESLIYLLFKYGFKKAFTPYTRFWVQLLLSVVLMIMTLNALLTLYVLTK